MGILTQINVLMQLKSVTVPFVTCVFYVWLHQIIQKELSLNAVAKGTCRPSDDCHGLSETNSGTRITPKPSKFNAYNLTIGFWQVTFLNQSKCWKYKFHSDYYFSRMCIHYVFYSSEHSAITKHRKN